ncbi:MAG: hypothetical protein O7E52_16665, partial [Candidatus Poribacteria bacterium]|nr:hypothetical protein [Candidatus Poribacteria bacterium]
QGTLPEWGGKGTVEFLARRIQAVTFLERIEDSNSQRCIARWLIGMRCLENGDRDGAKQNFSACIETGYFYTAICHWASAFLARLERDPQWPRSIQQDKQNP